MGGLAPYPFVLFPHAHYASLSELFVVPHFRIRKLAVFLKIMLKHNPNTHSPTRTTEASMTARVFIGYLIRHFSL